MKILTFRSDQMLAFTPDFEAMKKLGIDTPIAHVCCLTKRCDPDTDGCHFVSRCFAPWAGINEDPATGKQAFLGFSEQSQQKHCKGSLQCSLLPYWVQVWGKEHLLARQLFKNRGAEYELMLTDGGRRVKLVGLAVTMLEGVMHLPKRYACPGKDIVKG